MSKGKANIKKRKQQSKIQIKKQDPKNHLKCKRDEKAVCTTIDKLKDNGTFKTISTAGVGGKCNKEKKQGV